MIRNKTAKSTKSNKSTRLTVLAIVVITIGAFLCGSLLRTAWDNKGTKVIRAGDKQFRLQVADTQEEREQGLGGRKYLANNAGMLFEFQKANIACFWMKGMDFPLDMVWLNSQKKVIQTATNVSPATYPRQFCPPTPSLYVIELNAGAVSTSGIHVGQTLSF